LTVPGVSRCQFEKKKTVGADPDHLQVDLLLSLVYFRLTNSPVTFQTMMKEIFHNLILEGVICVYLNDILIFTNTIEEHRMIS
jgi:hypothetical protein